MGLILDSSVLIAAERVGQTFRELLIHMRSSGFDGEVGISVITIMELEHGIARADSPARRDTRRAFLNDVLTALPCYPVSQIIASRSGRLDGELAARGLRLATVDLLIGATALELGSAVLTGNLRHFRVIPELEVIEL